MNIGGLQQLSLIDFPGNVAAIVFTNGCAFRCGFCYNPDLVLPPFAHSISEKEFFEFLKKRINLLDGVVITGGEPTMHYDIIDFINKIKSLGFKVKLDTCGYFPALLKRIFENVEINYIAMDIKAPLDKYSEVVGIKARTENIQKSIDLIMKSGIQYEFRSTLVKEIHSSEDILEMAKLISGAQQYFLQSFRPMDKHVNPTFASYHPHSREYLEEIRKQCAQYVENCEIRG